MSRKPTVAGLMRQLKTAEEIFGDARRDASNANRELERALDRCGDLQSEVGALEKQVAWYEREREDVLQYFDDALRLLKPHLVSNPATGSITHAESPLDRFLLQIRERLSRYYSAHDDRDLYFNTPRR